MQEKNTTDEIKIADIAMQKENIAQSLYSIFIDLHKHFTWTVIETIISMQARLGKDNPYIAHVLKDIYETISPKQIEEYLPECSEHDVDIAEISAGLLNPKDYKQYSGAFSRSTFNVNMNIPEECQPWDVLEQSNPDIVMTNNTTMIIQNIKMKLSRLAMFRGIIARNPEAFKNEITTIDALFEVLDFQFTF